MLGVRLLSPTSAGVAVAAKSDPAPGVCCASPPKCAAAVVLLLYWLGPGVMTAAKLEGKKKEDYLDRHY